MAEQNWRKFTTLWSPDSYTADSVEPIMNVAAGTLIGTIICRTVEVFNGSGTDAIFELGDDGDVDRYVDGGELEETSISAATSQIRAAGASGGGYVLYRSHLYTTANTIDVNFTANTAGTRTTGKVAITIYYMRAYPD